MEIGKGPLVTALKTAQGLGLDGAGNLLVTEHDAGRLDLVLLTFKLPPFPGPLVLSPGQPVCVQVARAAGFGDAVRLDAGQGYRVLKQPEGGQPGEVLPEACARQCSVRILASSGGRTDGAWLTYRSS